MTQTSILGVKVNTESFEQTKVNIQKQLISGKSLVFVVTPNPEQLIQAQDDHEFREILNQADYAVVDGVGLAKVLEFKSGRKTERVAGADLAEALVKFCLEGELTVAFLGGRKGVASKAKKAFGESGQKINVVKGVESIEKETELERTEILSKLKQIKPDLLLVAYGAPHQEKWIWQNKQELEKAGIKVAMVVGGTFDYWAGTVKRAPLIVRTLGLEWLWRLVLEPWRWKRQLRLVRFVWLTVRG